MSVGLSVFLLAGAGGDSNLRSLPAYIAYAWGTSGLTVDTIYSWSLGGGKTLPPPRRRTQTISLPLEHSRRIKAGYSLSRRGRDQVAYT